MNETLTPDQLNTNLQKEVTSLAKLNIYLTDYSVVIKDYVKEFAMRIPIPTSFYFDTTGSLLIRFKCEISAKKCLYPGSKGSYFELDTNTNWKRWLRLGLLLTTVGQSKWSGKGISKSSESVRTAKDIFTSLSGKSDESSFLSFISTLYLNGEEQNNVVDSLKKASFFTVMKFNPITRKWSCESCSKSLTTFTGGVGAIDMRSSKSRKSSRSRKSSKSRKSKSSRGSRGSRGSVSRKSGKSHKKSAAGNYASMNSKISKKSLKSIDGVSTSKKGMKESKANKSSSMNPPPSEEISSTKVKPLSELKDVPDHFSEIGETNSPSSPTTNDNDNNGTEPLLKGIIRDDRSTGSGASGTKKKKRLSFADDAKPAPKHHSGGRDRSFSLEVNTTEPGSGMDRGRLDPDGIKSKKKKGKKGKKSKEDFDSEQQYTLTGSYVRNLPRSSGVSPKQGTLSGKYYVWDGAMLSCYKSRSVLDKGGSPIETISSKDIKNVVTPRTAKPGSTFDVIIRLKTGGRELKLGAPTYRESLNWASAMSNEE